MGTRGEAVIAALRGAIAPARRPLRWLLPVAVLLSILLLQWWAPGWAERAEAWTVDVRFQLRGAQAPRSPIIVVALDEASFQMLGDLQGENIRTWPRARWATLIERIAAGSPRVIGLDVVLDTPGWDVGGDEALAAALRVAGNVVLAAHRETQSQSGQGLVTFSPPIVLLQEAAAATGVAAFPNDADDAVRRTALLYPWGGEAYPSFPLAAATLWSGVPLRVEPSDLRQDGTLAIHFRGPEGTFQTVSMIDVWLGDVGAETFRDAIVLVGYTTELEQDRHAAPFGGREGLPGVEIQANAIDTLLAGDWLYRPPAWLVLLRVGLAGLTALALLNLRRIELGVLLLLGALAVDLLLAAALFAWADWLLPLVAPLAAALATGATVLVERVALAERERRQLRQRFAGVMSPERLRAVLERWEELLQPQRPTKSATILFSDIRGFTSATESLSAQGRFPEMIDFLSQHMDAMSEAIFAEGGVIHNVMGDGLMVLFGLPEPLPDHAMQAVRAALRMAQAVKELQGRWPLRDVHPFEMGIGLHCGPVLDAVLGRGRRVEYSVIGDAVNTAARIETHCKVVKEIPLPPGAQVPATVTILLSTDLYEQVRERVVVDENIPPFVARGKAEPLHVVRLLGLRK